MRVTNRSNGPLDTPCLYDFVHRQGEFGEGDEAIDLLGAKFVQI